MSDLTRLIVEGYACTETVARSVAVWELAKVSLNTCSHDDRSTWQMGSFDCGIKFGAAAVR